MSPRAKVLYVCYDVIPAPKGASTHVTSFVSALSARYDVTLISLSPDPQSPSPTAHAYDPAAIAEGSYCGARHLRVSPSCMEFLDRALQFRDAVWDTLQDGAYELVHFRTMWAALPVSEERRRQGFSVVCEVNGVDSIELKYHFPALRSHPEVIGKLRRQELLGFSCADALVTVSSVTARYIAKQGIGEERIRVIPNGVDLELFHPQAEQDGGPQGPSHGDTGTINLLYIGTLAPWQGVDFLIEAFHQACSVADAPGLQLRILGPLRRQWVRPLEKLISKRGLGERVQLLSPVPHEEVPALIRASDICLAPLMPTERNTVQGCNPVKLFEYMACGKAIIASRLAVVQEMLTDGEDALLFSPSKPNRLAECIVRLAQDEGLRRSLGGSALRKVTERYQWRHANEALLAVYDGLLGEHDAETAL